MSVATSTKHDDAIAKFTWIPVMYNLSVFLFCHVLFKNIFRSIWKEGSAALWRIIHLLEERVEVLENTLEVSRENISKTEEKCDNLQRQGKSRTFTLV